jgi:hypothetical protein
MMRAVVSRMNVSPPHLRPPDAGRAARARTATLLISTALVTITLTVSCPGIGLAGQARRDRGGAELYQDACVACHGPDGRGAARDRVGFDTSLPDFSDCRFATPEPDADWIAVIHRGGPARAFDRRMPAFGDALADDEIARIVEHLRGFCRDTSWPRGELNLPRALFTEKAFPENEAVMTTSLAASGDGAIDHALVYEQRFGARNQLEVALPFSAIRHAGDWTGGFGDLSIAGKRVLAHSLERGAILSVSTELIVPTGEDRIGGGVTRIEPFVAFGQLLPADRFIQAQAGIELSTHRARAPHEAFWRVAFGQSFSQQRFGRTWSPALEILGARELESGQPIAWDVVPQMQVTLSRRQHIAFSGGVRLPVNQRESRHPQIVMYLLWDWADGGLRSGW